MDPVNVDMSHVAPVVRSKNEFEKCALKHLKTSVSNHSTYMSRFDAIDKEIVALPQQPKAQNMEESESGEEVEEDYD